MPSPCQWKLGTVQSAGLVHKTLEGIFHSPSSPACWPDTEAPEVVSGVLGDSDGTRQQAPPLNPTHCFMTWVINSYCTKKSLITELCP